MNWIDRRKSFERFPGVANVLVPSNRHHRSEGITQSPQQQPVRRIICVIIACFRKGLSEPAQGAFACHRGTISTNRHRPRTFAHPPQSANARHRNSIAGCVRYDAESTELDVGHDYRHPSRAGPALDNALRVGLHLSLIDRSGEVTAKGGGRVW